MKELIIKRKLNEISKLFKNDKFDLITIANLIDEVREYITVLSKEEFDLLMKVPIEVLNYDCVLKDEEEWIENNREYFSGNVEWLNDKYFENLGRKFKENRYDTDDLIESVKYISDNYDLLKEKFKKGIETPLRNIEVTIRDDIKLLYTERFNTSGNIFAQYLDKAIAL